MLSKILSGASGVEKLFSTDLYTGNGTSSQIINNIDLASSSGLVMINNRNYTSGSLCGFWWNKPFLSIGVQTQHITWWQSSGGTYWSGQQFTIGSFNGNGYTVTGSDQAYNASGLNYVAHTFKRAKDFYYDTYSSSVWTSGYTEDYSVTGGISTLGMVAMWQTNQTGSTHAYIWHRSCSANSGFNVSNSTNSPASETNTSSKFTVSGTTLTLPGDPIWPFGAVFFSVWAHDPNKIVCDEYTGNGSATGPSINLGWKPQFLMVKRKTGGNGDWLFYDNVRDSTNPITIKTLQNLLQGDDTSGEDVDFNATGFQLKSTSAQINANGSSYIYMAVREQ